jgi:hypothetical protein
MEELPGYGRSSGRPDAKVHDTDDIVSVRRLTSIQFCTSTMFFTYHRNLKLVKTNGG